MKMVVLVMSMALVAMLVKLAASSEHTVGSPGGSWDLQTDVQTWAQSTNFVAGDSLIFQYSAAMHNVLEVLKSDYESCTTSSPVMADSSGNTAVSLKTAGKRYFICGMPGHCAIGMKMEVDIHPVGKPPPPPSATPKRTPSSNPFKILPPIPFKPPPKRTPSSTPLQKLPPFPSTPRFQPPPSFIPKAPSSKASTSPPSPASKVSASPATASMSPAPALAPMSSPNYKGPETPLASPSLPPITSVFEKRGSIQPLLGISIAMVLIATYGF